MIYTKYNPKKFENQLALPGFAAWQLRGYPIRGLMRCMALCAIHGWPHLGRLAAAQLGKTRGRP
jgi:hypothetical protein